MRRQTISFAVSMLVLALSTSVIVVSPTTGQDTSTIIDKLNQLYGELEGEKPALQNKVNAVMHQIDSGAFSGAVNKLENDVKKSVIAWVENPDELIQLIDEIIDLIKGIAPPPPTPDFEISSIIDRLDVAQSGTDTTKITITSIRNFTREVNLSVTTTATRINVTVDPDSVTPPAGGSVNSTLIVKADQEAVLGEYEITIKAMSGSLEHDLTIPLKIVERTPPPPKDFSVTASPATLIIQKGKANVSIVTVTSINGFEEQVNLTVALAEITGVSITLDPNKVIPPPDAYAISVLVVDVSDTATPDTYTVTITAVSSSIQHNVNISLTITEPPVPPRPDFSINAYPTSITMEQGENQPVTLVLTSLKGFTGSITLTISSEPIQNVTLSLIPAQVELAPDAFAASTLTVYVGVEAEPNEYEITITGTSGSSLQHSIVIPLEILLESKPPRIISVARLPKDAPAYNETVSVQASVFDLESGLKDVILAVLAGGAEQNLTMNLNNGLYAATISAFPFNMSVQYGILASDNVGNWIASLPYSYIVVDPHPPVIESLTWQPETPAADEPVTVNATVREPPEASGVKMVMLWYKNTTTNDWKRVPMTQILNTANWTATISNQSGTKVEFYIEAIDRAENRNQSTTETFDVPTSAFPLAWILAAIVILAGATGAGAYYARRRRKKSATGITVPPAAVQPVPATHQTRS